MREWKNEWKRDSVSVFFFPTFRQLNGTTRDQRIRNCPQIDSTRLDSTCLHCTFEIRLLAKLSSWLAGWFRFIRSVSNRSDAVSVAHINMNNSKLYTTTNPHKFENWSLFRNSVASEWEPSSCSLAFSRLSFLYFHSFYTRHRFPLFKEFIRIIFIFCVCVEFETTITQ